MKFAIKLMQCLVIPGLILTLSGCVNKNPSIHEPGTYKVKGKVYKTLRSAKGYKARGLASYYSNRLHRHKTSNGERYNKYSMTAAHPTLPFNTRLRVTNLNNGRTVVVRINDRGPFYKARIIDLSYAAASRLGIKSPSMVEIQTVN